MKLVYENEKSGFRVYEEEDGNATIVYQECLARSEVFTHGLYESQRDKLDGVAIAYLRSVVVHEVHGSPFGDALIQKRDPDPSLPLCVSVDYAQTYWPNPEPPL